MLDEIAFRPHHFLCAFCFQGKGYSRPFIKNFMTIMQALNSSEGENKIIKVISQADAICLPCPHRRDTSCVSAEKINELDEKHRQALEIKIGDTMPWKKAKERIKEKITLDVFHQICRRVAQMKRNGIGLRFLDVF